MSEPYLIAHSVYGRAAFDVATSIDCPECTGQGCLECDGKGFWWIIPTSGHRAYPFHAEPLNKDMARYQEAMPPAWPDHYKAGPAPKLDIKSLFKSAKPTMQRRL